VSVAKPNYGFEKRQKELAKKRKQEEKRLRKLAGREPIEGASVEPEDRVVPDAIPPGTDANS
jgi:hypothetical protein